MLNTGTETNNVCEISILGDFQNLAVLSSWQPDLILNLALF